MELKFNSKEKLSLAKGLSKELTSKRGSLPQRKAFFNMFNKLEPNWLLERFPIAKNRRRYKNYYSHSNVYFLLISVIEASNNLKSNPATDPLRRYRRRLRRL
eukprot:TRINITY_DN8625_c0_g1_i13.p4 TRINITY_DN8625_c0_g1~~TRINITY_DN8625_c0_g1_i13.p4  ORF type:complete len:102 (-),score=18.60 TRINITY_DN8625_c0_g1_i13:1281-1586(-)